MLQLQNKNTPQCGVLLSLNMENDGYFKDPSAVVIPNQ